MLNGMLNGWALIDAAIVLGLSYGVYRKNRASAVALLGFYLVNQVLMRVGGDAGAGIGLVLVFSFFFVQGVRGTFAYHRFTHQDDTASAV
jgi:hypothetical protein